MIELRVDRYHSGLRLAALGLWVAAIAAVYFSGHWLAGLLFGPPTSFTLLVLAGLALILAQPVALLAEGWLVRVWPSGRALKVEGSLVTLSERSGLKQIRLDQPAAFRRWRFEVRTRRGGHVPRGHHCLALRLSQADQTITAYAFFSPTAMRDITTRFPFYELQRAKDAAILAAPPAGRDPAYLEAENDRWIFGAELDDADFDQLLATLAPHLADFTAKPGA